ncbi:MAG: hypothetical protein VX278_13790, partial [Myxococcota bacterium]|nr:hypothetical protein [Myxococcota bacterium]
AGLLACTPNSLLVGDWTLVGYGESSSGEFDALPQEVSIDAALEAGTGSFSTENPNSGLLSFSYQISGEGALTADVQIEVNTQSSFRYEIARTTISINLESFTGSDTNASYWQNVIQTGIEFDLGGDNCTLTLDDRLFCQEYAFTR